MSMVRCDRCDYVIDSDEDLSCFCGNRVLCESHRCHICDERESDCDDTCHKCTAEQVITGAEHYDPDQRVSYDPSRRLWDEPGYREAEKLILAARQSNAYSPTQAEVTRSEINGDKIAMYNGEY